MGVKVAFNVDFILITENQFWWCAILNAKKRNLAYLDSLINNFSLKFLFLDTLERRRPQVISEWRWHGSLRHSRLLSQILDGCLNVLFLIFLSDWFNKLRCLRCSWANLAWPILNVSSLLKRFKVLHTRFQILFRLLQISYLEFDITHGYIIVSEKIKYHEKLSKVEKNLENV